MYFNLIDDHFCKSLLKILPHFVFLVKKKKLNFSFYNPLLFKLATLVNILATDRCITWLSNTKTLSACIALTPPSSFFRTIHAIYWYLICKSYLVTCQVGCLVHEIFCFVAGHVGDWKNHFSADQEKQFSLLFQEKMKGSSLAARYFVLNSSL